MIEVRKIICDGCGADLTSAGNSVDYRLVLASQPKRGRGGFVTDMMIWDPLPEGPKHFCGFKCLETWLADRNTTPEEAAG